MRKINVILNAASGKGGIDESALQVKKLLAARNIEANIFVAKTGAELAGFAEKAAGSECQIVVAGGGDGTVGIVASALAYSEKVLGVLPLGTLNHFAKDLNIPLDLTAATAVIADGNIKTIDLGEANGKIFINNSSLGIYPEMVHGREQRERLGYGKWHSLLRSALVVFHRYPLLNVRLTIDGKEVVTQTPFLFVGNNKYQLEDFDIGGREKMDDGVLSVYLTRRTGRLAFLRIAVKSVLGGLSQEKDFLSSDTEEINVETKRSHVRVAIDGEVSMMETPILYRIRPQALRVIVPHDEAK